MTMFYMLDSANMTNKLFWRIENKTPATTLKGQYKLIAIEKDSTFLHCSELQPEEYIYITKHYN